MLYKFFGILLVAGILAISAFLFPGKGVPISWIPEKIEKDQFIGTSQVINATFKSTKEIENVKFWLTPRLSKYAKVEPETIAKIEKNKEYNISIIVSIPTDFKTRKHEKDNFKESLKTYLNEDFDEKEYKQDFKDQEEFFKDFSADKIRGLLFVAEEKQTKWPNFIKQKRTVRKIYPLPLKIIIDVKKATAQDVLEPFIVPTDASKIVTFEDVKFPVNEIVVALADGAKLTDAIEIARLVNGIITGFVPDPPFYKIGVETDNISELNNMVDMLRNSGNTLIIGVIQNILSE